MIVAAAVCPGAPALIPGLADEIVAGVPELLAACRAATAGLREADRIAIVSGPPAGRSDARDGVRLLIPGTRVDAWRHGRSDLRNARGLALPGGPAEPVGTLGTVGTVGTVGNVETVDSTGANDAVEPQAGTLVGLALLAATGLRQPTWAVELDGPGQVPLHPAADEHGWGLLVLADGAARHGDDAPGRRDDRSAALDRGIAAALATGDPAALAAAVRDHDLSAELMATIDGLRLLAEWTASAPPSTAEVTYDARPFGVGYLVARWSWVPA